MTDTSAHAANVPPAELERTSIRDGAVVIGQPPLGWVRLGTLSEVVGPDAAAAFLEVNSHTSEIRARSQRRLGHSVP
jgi:hypothetical protein